MHTYKYKTNNANKKKGVSVCIFRIVSKLSFVSNKEGYQKGAILYFGLGAITTISCVLGFVWIWRSSFVQYHIKKYYSVRAAVDIQNKVQSFLLLHTYHIYTQPLHFFLFFCFVFSFFCLCSRVSVFFWAKISILFWEKWAKNFFKMSQNKILSKKKSEKEKIKKYKNSNTKKHQKY